MMCFFDGQYPKTAAMIRGRAMRLRQEAPHIVGALEAVIEDKKLVDRGLSEGTYPRVGIFKYEHANGWRDFSKGGHFHPREPNMIYLSHWWVHDYLEMPWEGDGEPETIFRLLLHEFCHWGRHAAGLSAEKNGDEAGNLFEHLAFGTPLEYHGTRVIRGQAAGS